MSAAKLDLISRLPDKIPFKNINKSTFKFIDLFAGVGGIRMPFQELDGECVFSSEWDKFAQKTYAVNYGELQDVITNYMIIKRQNTMQKLQKRTTQK